MAERDDDAVNEASEGERDLRLLARPLSDLHLLTQAEKVWVCEDTAGCDRHYPGAAPNQQSRPE